VALVQGIAYGTNLAELGEHREEVRVLPDGKCGEFGPGLHIGPVVVGLGDQLPRQRREP
jgi:hypothetical protein